MFPWDESIKMMRNVSPSIHIFGRDTISNTFKERRKNKKREQWVKHFTGEIRPACGTGYEGTIDPQVWILNGKEIGLWWIIIAWMFWPMKKVVATEKLEAERKVVVITARWWMDVVQL